MHGIWTLDSVKQPKDRPSIDRRRRRVESMQKRVICVPLPKTYTSPKPEVGNYLESGTFSVCQTD